MTTDLTPERWARIEDLFGRAAAAEGPEREAVLDEAETPELRAEVEALLGVHGEAGTFLEPKRPAGTVEDDLVGKRLGVYEVTARLGAGGMGAVYAARRADETFEKQVAIKVIKRGMDAEHVVERFRQERRVLAALEHPNIARVLDGGLTGDNRPYLVMEYVAGEPIDHYCETRSLSVRDRLELFRQVCAAVQYAHQNLVVHRDLKPANILVNEDGAVRLLDFGIAKVLGPGAAPRDGTLTVAGSGPMTPYYASPEQVRSEPITTASDVYSLGVLLYELLAGVRPYELTTHTPQEYELVICERMPPRPSAAADAALVRTLRGDLDWITLKAMEKAPARRYSSASEMSADIGRYLRDEPVLAGAPSAAYRMRKFVRRHRLGVAAAALIGVSLVAAVVGTSWGIVRANRSAEAEGVAREEAVDQADIATTVSNFLDDMLSSPDPWAADALTPVARDVRVVDVLDRASESLEKATLRPEVEAAVRSTLGETYRKLGDYEPAARHLERALALRMTQLGEEDDRTITSMSELGQLRLQQSRPEEAAELFARVVEIERETLGDEHPFTLKNSNNLALANVDLGDYPEAERLYRRTLDVLERTLGPDDEQTIVTTANLGTLMRKHGRHDEAETFSARALAARRRVSGDDHPSTAGAMTELANVYQETQRAAEAEAMLIEVLEIYRRQLGDEHPRTMGAMGSRASAALRQDRFEEASRWYEELVPIQARVLGDDHDTTRTSRNNLAWTYHGLGRLDEAEAIFRETRDALMSQFGPEHPSALTVQHNLCMMIVEAGRLEEGEALYRKTLAGRRRALGDEARETLTTMNNLAVVLEDLGKVDEALALEREVYEIRRRTLGPGDRATLIALNNLANTVRDLNGSTEAEPLFVELAARGEESMADDNWLRWHFNVGLGTCLRDLERYDEAEERLLMAYEGLRATRGPEDGFTTNAAGQLVTLFKALDDAERVEHWEAIASGGD